MARTTEYQPLQMPAEYWEYHRNLSAWFRVQALLKAYIKKVK